MTDIIVGLSLVAISLTALVVACCVVAGSSGRTMNAVDLLAQLHSTSSRDDAKALADAIARTQEVATRAG